MAILLSMNDEINLSIRGGIATITVNRPKARNALNSFAQEEFAKAIDSLFSTQKLRIVIVTASGTKTFVSGGDLKELALASDPSSGERLNRVMGSALARLPKLPVPVIGAVNGDAIGGGCEILTACDLRIAASRARFRFAEVGMALTTGWGGTARLVHLIGLSRSLDLLLTGRSFDAQEALSIGFINRIAADDESVLDAAERWASELAALPREALAAAKDLAWSTTQMGMTEQLLHEKELFSQLWRQADNREAMNAFNEKRSPQFNQGNG